MASKKVKLFGRQTVSMQLKGDLKQALEDFGERVKAEAFRPAAYAAAKTLYDEMRRLAPVGDGEKTKARLQDAIYHYFVTDRSTDEKKIYAIGVNKSKAPHWHLVEYGYFQRYPVYFNSKTGEWVTVRSSPYASPRKVPARSYIRAAYANKIDEALKNSKIRLAEKIKELV